MFTNPMHFRDTVIVELCQINKEYEEAYELQIFFYKVLYLDDLLHMYYKTQKQK